MQNAYSGPVAVCRPALPSDKADVMEFTSFIWEGRDCIKYVWDEWGWRCPAGDQFRIAMLSGLLDLEKERIRAWGICHAVLSAW